MDKQTCRLCQAVMPVAPLIRLENMPAAAQYLPDAAGLAADQSVDLDILQCPACGLVQTGNDPVPYYRDVIRAAGFSDEMKDFRRQQFADFAGQYGLSGRKTVEIGCGRGEYLALLREAGLAAHGLEHDALAVRYCLEQGLSATQGFVDDPAAVIEGGPFDVFVALNFLEHWPDPVGGLRGIAGNLNAGGIGLVEVPNFDMILARGLFTEFISDHLCYFTRETLETTLRLAGFEVLACTEVWYGYILSAVVRKRAPCDVSAFVSRRSRLQAALNAFLERHAPGGVAIWGAGHQALATLALLDLGGRVRYVVDSAPFKQNRYTAASHIPIVAPEHLLEDPVGAVIVMAASYSDEVAKIVCNRFGQVEHVAILRDHGLERVS
jgi:SAM-dependent methyltransferase